MKQQQQPTLTNNAVLRRQLAGAAPAHATCSRQHVVRVSNTITTTQTTTITTQFKYIVCKFSQKYHQHLVVELSAAAGACDSER